MMKIKNTSEPHDNPMYTLTSSKKNVLCDAAMKTCVADAIEKFRGEDEDEFHSCDESDTNAMSEIGPAGVSADYEPSKTKDSVSLTCLCDIEHHDSCSTVSSIEGLCMDEVNTELKPCCSNANYTPVSIALWKQAGHDVSSLRDNFIVNTDTTKSHKLDGHGGILMAGLNVAGAVAISSALTDASVLREGENAEIETAEIPSDLRSYDLHNTESSGKGPVTESTMAPCIGKEERDCYDLESVQANCSSGDVGTLPLQVENRFGSSHISTNSSSSPPGSPCDSPGVFFSCFTSMSDIRDEPFSSGQKCTELPSSQVETHPRLRHARENDLRRQFNTKADSPPLQQQSTSNESLKTSSGLHRSRHPRRRKHSNTNDKTESAHSVSLITSKHDKTKLTSPMTEAVTSLYAVLNSGPSMSLSTRRDAHKSLAPLAIAQPPLTRRAKSASPIPSRIPRPVVRERAIRRTPSGPTLHSEKSQAMASRSISVCSERDTHFRRWSRLQSPHKSSAPCDLPGRPKFISGKGGTAWIVPANIGHFNRNMTETGADCSSTYTKNTFSSTSKRRNKAHHYQTPANPLQQIPFKQNKTRSLNKKLLIASDVHYPTPPSSCPPHSPVSFPSVGSSPIVLVNEQSEENFFFPKTFPTSNPQRPQSVSLKADKESENHALKISGRVSTPTKLTSAASEIPVVKSRDFNTMDDDHLPQATALPVEVSAQHELWTQRSGDKQSSHWNTEDNHLRFKTPCAPYNLHNCTDNVQLYSLDYVATNDVQSFSMSLDSLASSHPLHSPDTASYVNCGQLEPGIANTCSFTEPPAPSDGVYQASVDTYYSSGSWQDNGDSTYGSLPCTVDSLPCTVDTLPCTAGSLPCTAGSLPCTAGSLPCTADSLPCTVDSLPYTVDSLPCTLDSLVDYPSLSLSYVSTSLGKEVEVVDPCCCSAMLDGHEQSESEDSLEEYAWIHMSGGGELCTRPRALNKRNVHKAKLRASLAWLLSKVYGADVPREMQDPFYETSQGQLALRPVLVNMMSSSELYCQACSNMFPETHAQWSGHWSIIQVLSRKGIYVGDTHESAVTETVLVQTAPFKLKAHLALIDALMRAYMCEVASVEKVVKAVRNFTTFPASSELPGSPEESLKFWINKVCALVTRDGVGTCHKEKQLLEGDAGQKVLVTTSANGSSRSEPVTVPLLEDMMGDVGDGSSVAALIAYYRPHQLDIRSICLKDSIGIADSLYNLRLIGQFCRAHLPWRRFHLSYEDLLYTHASMHINICTFLADLFFCFEGPSCGQSSSATNAINSAKEKLDAMPAAGKRSVPNTPSSAAAVASPIPISNATKKSFQHRGSLEDTAGNLGLAGRSTTPGSLPGQHQPLLPRRSGGRRSFAQDDGSGVGGLMSSGGVMTSSSPPTSRRGRRTVSLCSPQDRDIVQRSVLAWQDDQTVASGHNRVDRRASGAGRSSGNLLANVSIDSNLDRSLNTDTSLSLDLGPGDTPRTGRHSALDPGHPDYLEIESVTSGQPSRFASPHSIGQSTGRSTTRAEVLDGGDQASLEPLMPAVLKPTKERDALLSKAQERGDRTARRRKVSSPSDPPPHMHQQQHQQQLTASGDEFVMSLSASSSATTVSPLPGDEGADQFSSQMYSDQLYAGESVDLAGELPNSARSNAALSVAESYTLQDRPNTVQEARAAGIPVVLDSVASGSTLARRPDCSREGSVASSGDYSDHESHKIHQDHKLRESGHQGQSDQRSCPEPATVDATVKPTMALISDQLVSSGSRNNNNNNSSGNNNSILSALKAPPISNTTNFAELKRLKDNLEFNIDKVDNSALIYMQSGSQGEPHGRSPGGTEFKSAFLNSQGQGYGKTTTFGQLSPMADRPSTHTMSNGLSSPTAMSPSNGSVMTTSDPGSSELQQLRLKLEQKRKEIERKKHRQEAQQNKMRQRLGKAAFMRVVSKHMEEGEEGEEANGDGPPVRRELSPASSTAAQIQARLGMNSQRQPVSVHRPQPAVGPGHLATGTVPPPEASAQRFTDWRSQTQRKIGHVSGQIGEESQDGEVSRATPSAAAGSTHAFSRAGIQQTIDNVRNKWFSGGVNDDTSLLVTPGLDAEDHADGQGDSFRLHENNLLGARGSPRPSPNRMSPSPQAVGHFQPRPAETLEVSQPKRAGSVPRQLPSSSAPQQQLRRASDSSGEIYDPQYQEYDSSLDKLNTSLSDLQGEIMRLSLQHEQGKANGLPPPAGDPRLSSALSAIGSTAAGTVHTHHPPHSGQTRPIHGIPHQAPFMLTERQPHREPCVTSVPYTPHQQGPADISLQEGQAPGLSRQQQQHSSHSAKQQHQQQPTQTPELDSESLMPQSKDGGFFVSFGEASSPKRAKPRLGEHRSTPTSHMTSHTPTPTASVRQQQQQQQQQRLFVPGSDPMPSPDLDPAVAAVVAGQAVAPLTPASKTDLSGEDKGGSPSVGFVIQDQSTIVADTSAEDEMQRKKTKLMEMQRKRKEDQERKRAEKEAELARKQEEKMFKEEEQERRKVEEKARRDQIFQQYLQKKAEEDVDGPPSSHAQAAAKAKVKRRDRSASNSIAANKQRPKSMFVKAATPEPGALGHHDSCNSSQEDLARAAAGGRSTPGVMSAKRSAYNFRMPQQNRMRKAVSCNTLQGPGATHGHTGHAGHATFRRPPSPDLYKLKQQQQQHQQRGNSQDSGSDNGSNPGSNPGSEFSGPKLYVKPSAKSNRHIIVNAISHCCLAGSVNTDQKNKVLEEMSKCDANHFLILFRDAGCQYRGLFILYPDSEEAVKVCGVGPRHITNKMCEKFYKYNSGGKSFSEIVSKKHLSVSVDAVVLLNSLWKSGKAAVKR